MKFTEYAAQLALDAVDHVKERTAVHFQLATAELPIGAKKKMKAENPVFGFVQITLANETEIGDVFFVAATPDLTAVPPAEDFEPDMAHMFFLADAVLKTGHTDSEDRPKDAVTGGFDALPTAATQSKTMAMRAGFFR